MNIFTRSTVISTLYEFEDEFNYFCANNPSNSLPYHNLYHSLCVMCEVDRIVSSYKKFQITYNQRRNLLIASLYHDYNYTIGQIPDRDKVNKTIQSLPDKFKFDSEVSEIIRYTIYPYEKDLYLSDDISIVDYMGLILREADLCQCLHDNSIHQCIYGLKEEMDPYNNMTYLDFIDRYIKFIEGINYQILDRDSDKKEVLSNLKYLKSCFKDAKEKS